MVVLMKEYTLKKHLNDIITLSIVTLSLFDISVHLPHEWSQEIKYAEYCINNSQVTFWFANKTTNASKEGNRKEKCDLFLKGCKTAQVSDCTLAIYHGNKKCC